MKGLATVLVTTATIAGVGGCRDTTLPLSQGEPSIPISTVWDSLGLGGVSVQALAVDGARILAGTANGLFRSLDSGRTWLYTPSINGRSSFTSVAISGPNFLIGTDTVLSLSSNAGGSWLALIEPIKVYGMAQGSSHLFVASSMGMIRSSNNGINWTIINAGLPQRIDDFVSLSVEDATVHLGLSSSTYISTDNGEAWIRSQIPWSENSLRKVFVQRTILYAATSTGIYTSRTRGSSWFAADVDVPTSAQVIAFAAVGGVVFAATSNAGIYSTQNDGISWFQYQLQPRELTLSALVADRRTVYAATRNRGIWRLYL